jgi:hypothetical protein
MTRKSSGLRRAEASPTLQQRFDAKCGKPDANGCIPWLGVTINGGYGVLSFKGNHRTTANRIAWVLKRGDIPPEILVLHKCDNPPCVNVEHLFLGTYLDNVQDMVSKDRHAWRDWTVSQKLNKVDSERIFDLRHAGYAQQHIANWMFVSRSLISMVLAGKFRYFSSPYEGY